MLVMNQRLDQLAAAQADFMDRGMLDEPGTSFIQIQTYFWWHRSSDMGRQHDQLLNETLQVIPLERRYLMKIP